MVVSLRINVYNKLIFLSILTWPKILNSVLIGKMCAYQEVRNVRFSENSADVVFMQQPLRDSSFLLKNPYCYCFIDTWLRVLATFSELLFCRTPVKKLVLNAVDADAKLNESFFREVSFMSLY